MDICCYILHSKSLNRFYIGACQESLDERIRKHNSHSYGKTTYTSIANDWRLFLRIDTFDYAHTIRIERKIKSMKSAVYIRNLEKYAELKEKLYETTR